MSTDNLDVKDSAGRMNRIIIAVLCGAAVAGITWFVSNALVKPELEPHTTQVVSQQINGYGFVVWATGIAFAVALGVALVIQNAIAKKKWREGLVAKARVV